MILVLEAGDHREGLNKYPPLKPTGKKEMGRRVRI